MKIVTETGEVSMIGPRYPGKFKWLRGARGPDGCIYGIPLHAETVLKIDPTTDEVTTMGGPFKSEVDGDGEHCSGGSTFKWHGGVVATDGCIYGIPANAESVLKIDCRTGTVSTFGGPLPGKNKWYGGLLGGDGCIYGIPQCANTVLKINPFTQEVTLLGNLDSGGWKWHGGVVGADGNIYGIPSNADSVLKIVPSTGEVSTIGDVRNVTPHRKDGKYKWLGGVLASDGAVYGMPGDADCVLRIAPYTSEVTLIGGPFTPEMGNTDKENKWQNGFMARDGCVYGIPLRAESVIKIKVATQEVSTIPILPDGVGRDKWEGGVVGDDGCLYGMPQRAKNVLKIKPAAPRNNERLLVLKCLALSAVAAFCFVKLARV
jgi:hypothetical protein